MKMTSLGQTRFYHKTNKSEVFNNFIEAAGFNNLKAACPSGTVRWLLRKQYCDASSITAAGRLLRHIRGWLETRRARAHFPVTLISPLLFSSLSCKSSVDMIWFDLLASLLFFFGLDQLDDTTPELLLHFYHCFSQVLEVEKNSVFFGLKYFNCIIYVLHHKTILLNIL